MKDWVGEMVSNPVATWLSTQCTPIMVTIISQEKRKLSKGMLIPPDDTPDDKSQLNPNL